MATVCVIATILQDIPVYRALRHYHASIPMQDCARSHSLYQPPASDETFSVTHRDQGASLLAPRRRADGEWHGRRQLRVPPSHSFTHCALKEPCNKTTQMER